MAQVTVVPGRSPDGPAIGSRPRRRYDTALALTIALEVGVLLRLGTAIATEFPANDGGLFFAMASDLVRASFMLPAFTSYNTGIIPFAYPPLGLYLAALASQFTGLPLIEVQRFLPAAVSVLAIPAFYLLARAMLPSKQAAHVAVVAYAISPRAFHWEIAGGGLTRAPGILFALLTVYCAVQLYVNRRPRFALGLSGFLALTLFSHPATAWYTVLTVLLTFLAYGRRREAVLPTIAAAAAAALVTAPWWALVVSRHGIGVFLSALGSDKPSWWIWLYPFIAPFTDEAGYSPLAILALIGLIVAVAERRWFLPGWFTGLLLVSPVYSRDFLAVPAAMLVGIAVAHVILPSLRGSAAAADPARSATDEPARTLRQPPRWLPRLVLGGGLVYVAILAIQVPGPHQASALRALTPEDRAAMNWVAAHTAPDARFLVFAADRLSSPQIATDRVSEWFPVLAARPSLLTVQGYEWLGRERLKRQVDMYIDVQLCADKEATCVTEAAARWDLDFTHIYIPKAEGSGRAFTDCCAALRNSLRASPDFSVIYEGPGATVFDRRSLAQGRLW